MASCASPAKVENASGATTTPTASAAASGASVGSDVSARADSCANAATAAANAEPKKAMRVVVEGCLSVYREQGCRDAQLKAVDDATDPSQRIRIITEGCAKAYCDKLPKKHPICGLDPNVDIVTYIRMGQDLMKKIQAYELGDDAAKRVADAFERAGAQRKQDSPH